MQKLLKNFKKKKVMIPCIVLILLLVGPYPLLYTATYGNGFSNSFYQMSGFLNQTVMVIVPHEDDELSVAGSIIKDLTHEDPDSDIIVVFTTNGDYVDVAQTRIEEAVVADAVVGIKPENIVFLGYGDQWNNILGERDLSPTENRHLYNMPDDAVIESFIGKTQTYGIEGYPDFRTRISGQPSVYTRNNYKADIKDVLELYLPDAIFAIDFDDHPDHRAVSLLFEEALCELLRENSDYAPSVYKGFSYNTGWKAVSDYYQMNLEATILPDKSAINDPAYELDVPQYDWEDRVRFPVPPEMVSYTIRSNLMYEALMKHKSQNTKLIVEKLSNSDSVFWERRTDSLTYDADITVSSGEAQFINDFKLIDCSNVLSDPAILDACVWEPLSEDTEKSVRIKWNTPETISCVTLYDDYHLEDNILSGTLLFSDGSKVEVGPLSKNGSATNIVFSSKKNITQVTFKVKETEGASPGLTEMEIFKECDSRAPQLIKVMLNNSTNTFVYRYRCPKSGNVALSAYIYPNTTENAYKMELVNDAHGEAELVNDHLTFKKSFLPHKCIVRVELVEHPEIYDEVEFVSYNWIDNIYYGCLQGYEIMLEKITILSDKIKSKIKSVL